METKFDPEKEQKAKVRSDMIIAGIVVIVILWGAIYIIEPKGLQLQEWSLEVKCLLYLIVSPIIAMFLGWCWAHIKEEERAEANEGD